MNRRWRDDAGITLIEVMVAMVVMSIVMVVFTTATIEIYRSSGNVQAATDATTQINIAYLRLDKEIRYASAVSAVSTSGDPDVEYLTTYTGTPICAELRITVVNHVSQLRWRSWPQSQTNLSTITWTALATNVAAPAGGVAFDVTPDDPVGSGSASTVQQLEVRLTTTTATTRQFDVTFTALNSNATVSNSSVCSVGRSSP